MPKFDIKVAHRSAYSGEEGTFSLIEVPPIRYLAVDGEGDPNSADDYRSAVEALYALAYAIKFASKAAGQDFVVAPLEGLWRSDDLGAFRRREKDAWRWTMLIAQPDWIDADALAAGREAVLKMRTPSHLHRAQLLTLNEGLCVQTLHVGSYDAEAAVLARLHDEYLPEQGLAPRADHHEIYLSDPRRTAPAKLKTLLRQPVERTRQP
ncbi:GyrI-like domain-containing protein [Naasia aerilata]|uniref:GyrI-like small molecule binding domain-containing protein n=1 Tax=Naasia aerilata TaxID=1162966 RepID=A0ABN6XHH4_9MICO|nr:GyrI-like domain-containing protein [Naasia aerilata]BDZ44337.1 hypothetical protein GCM10025866_02460 [Naasia aerilata]